MKATNIIPRVRADHLMIFAAGTHAAADTALALLHTDEYIPDIRGMVKTSKKWASAHDLVSRELLRLVHFPGALGPCLTKHEGGDVGGNFDTTFRGTGTTCNKQFHLVT